MVVGYRGYQAARPTKPMSEVDISATIHIERRPQEASRFDYMLLEMLSATAKSPSTEEEKTLDSSITAKQLLQKKLQSQMEIGYHLLIALHQSKREIDKLLGASSSKSVDQLKQLRQRYNEQILLLAEIGAFLGESEVRLMAKRLLGKFPDQADALLHRIRAFLRDHGY